MYQSALFRAQRERALQAVLAPFAERDEDDAARRIEERLRAHGHPWEVERLAYKHASHIMVPLETGALKLFREEREHPRECAASRLDAFKRTLAFLERW